MSACVGHCWAGDGVVVIDGRVSVDWMLGGSWTIETGAHRITDLDMRQTV